LNRRETENKAQASPATLTGKTAQAILWFLVLCAIAGFNRDPRDLLASLKFRPSQGISIISRNPVVIDRDDAPSETAQTVAPNVTLRDAAKVVGIDLDSQDLTGSLQPIEDPTGLAMRSFYEALARTKNKEPGAITRILHFGDSLVVVDFLTGQARRRLQTLFGDAGHGYMLAGKPWRWYQHWDVVYRTSNSWQVDGIMKHAQGQYFFGLGGYAFDGTGPSEWVEWGANNSGEYGRHIGRFEIHYLRQPGGGSFDLFVDGKSFGRVATASQQVRSGLHIVRVPDGPHKIRLQCGGDGVVRVFGGVLERDVPGIVYDTLGINGARARTLDRLNGAFWAEQLRLRKPHLIVLNFGTNESEDDGRPMDQVEQDYLAVLQRIRAAVPEASCLVMSPLDRAARIDGVLTTKPIIPRLVDTQRRAALKAGCAFFNTYQSMGGKGSMAKWYTAKPKLCAGDMTHPTRRGADIIGDNLYRSLVIGYVAHNGQTMVVTADGVVPTVLYHPLLPLEPDPYPPLPEWPRIPQ